VFCLCSLFPCHLNLCFFIYLVSQFSNAEKVSSVIFRIILQSVILSFIILDLIIYHSSVILLSLSHHSFPFYLSFHSSSLFVSLQYYLRILFYFIFILLVSLSSFFSLLSLFVSLQSYLSPLSFFLFHFFSLSSVASSVNSFVFGSQPSSVVQCQSLGIPFFSLYQFNIPVFSYFPSLSFFIF
jgi:hypothetical protein